MSAYPNREPFYSHKITRLLFKSCAAQSLGQDAVLLIIHIAHTEDAAKYQGPVRFWNSQLNEVLGFRSPKSLNNARAKSEAAGWLIYERKNDRTDGIYWTTIPDHVSRFDDAPIEPNNHDETPNPVSVPSTESIPSTEQKTERERETLRNGKEKGNDPPPIPIPIPKPIERPKRAIGQPLFSKEDSETAQWMFGLIQAMHPGHKPPNFDNWAEELRLIRERDKRTDAEIRVLFKAANGDSFWCKNILSPLTLRKQWDKLTIGLSKQGASVALCLSPEPKLRPHEITKQRVDAKRKARKAQAS